MPNQPWSSIRCLVFLPLAILCCLIPCSGYSLGQGFLDLSFGNRTSQIINNFGSQTGEGEPIPCGMIGGGSRWFGLRPVTNAFLRIDTIGSKIETVLAVYTGSNLLNLTFLTCDANSAPDGRA